MKKQIIIQRIKAPSLILGIIQMDDLIQKISDRLVIIKQKKLFVVNVGKVIVRLHFGFWYQKMIIDSLITLYLIIC